MIAIVTPTIMEMQSLLRASEHTFIYNQIEYAKAGYIEQGYFNGMPIYIGICGVGPVLSAITVSSWISQYTIECIFLCGIAGSYSIEHLPPTSVVLVKQDIYAEYGIRTKEYVSAQSFPFFHDSSHQICEKITLPFAQEQIESLQLHYTMCTEVVGLTVAGVSGDTSTAKILLQNYPQGEIETMEGFSVGLCCIRNNIPLLHLRSISNQVGVRSEWIIEDSLKALANTLSSFWSRPWI